MINSEFRFQNSMEDNLTDLCHEGGDVRVSLVALLFPLGVLDVAEVNVGQDRTDTVSDVLEK